MRNIGRADRVSRIALGLAMIPLVFVGPETPWAWFGLIPLATGLMKFCPVYTMLGICTSQASEHQRTIVTYEDHEQTIYGE